METGDESQQRPGSTPTSGEEESRGSGSYRPVLIGMVVAFGACLYGALYRFTPVERAGGPLFYALVGLGFVAAVVAFVRTAGGPGALVPRGRTATFGSRVVHWLLYGLILLLVAGVGCLGALGTGLAFVTLNGALDFGAPERRAYTVAEFRQDCGGSSRDRSHYVLEPRGAQGNDGPLRVRVGCRDDEGLPVDGGGTVPVGGEVMVEVKPGAFGMPWQGGYRAG